ncbi:MAG: hypothetical protein ACRDSZ_18095 [Pseudonocardiaceae bacterium]
MVSSELLGTYLNDHLAGSSTGAELAKKISEENAGTRYGSVLAELATEIDQDRATLAELMQRLNIERSAVKQAAGWITEKLTRVKFSDSLTGSADLKRLLEFETLSLGIAGKLALWRALGQVIDRYPELAATDFDALAKRAEDQRSRLEELRLDAASKALG